MSIEGITSVQEVNGDWSTWEKKKRKSSKVKVNKEKDSLSGNGGATANGTSEENRLSEDEEEKTYAYQFTGPKKFDAGDVLVDFSGGDKNSSK